MSNRITTTVLLKQLEKLTQRLSEIVTRDFPSLSEEQFNWREHEEKWSIAECILHLNYYADFHFPATQRAIKKAKSKPTTAFKSGWLGQYYIDTVQLEPNNFPKKVGISSIKLTPPALSESQINGQKELKRFLEYQRALLQMLQDAQNINIQSTKVGVAFFGLVRIRLGDMLQMLVYHTERHIVQAQRLLYHDYFPGNYPLDNLFND